MRTLWRSVAQARSALCAVIGFLSVCGAAALPARAQETKKTSGEAAAALSAAGGSVGDAARIRATSDARTGRSSPRIRFSLGSLLRDAALGVTWDRARLPLHVSLYGSQDKPVSVRLTLSRRDFNGATVRFRF